MVGKVLNYKCKTAYNTSIRYSYEETCFVYNYRSFHRLNSNNCSPVLPSYRENATRDWQAFLKLDGNTPPRWTLISNRSLFEDDTCEPILPIVINYCSLTINYSAVVFRWRWSQVQGTSRKGKRTWERNFWISRSLLDKSVGRLVNANIRLYMCSYCH